MLTCALGASLLALAAAPALAGVVLTTPAGLTAGETFRYVFVTDDTIAATSSSISTYNNFVTAQAGGATYDGAVVTWDAMVSTSAVSVKTNIGASTGAIYDVNGDLVATADGTATSLFSGTLLHSINLDIGGINKGSASVWTGYKSNGQLFLQLGSAVPVSSYGSSSHTDAAWSYAGGTGKGASHLLYGISELLTAPAAVPEPATWATMLVGIFGVGAALRRRRDQPGVVAAA